MIQLLQSILLGIIQGITEFFPISSSSHLKIFKQLTGMEGGSLVDLSCHLGTLCSLLFFFKKDLLKLWNKETVIALIPLLPLYFLLKPLRDWAQDIHLLGLFLILTGVILLAGQSLSMTRSQNKEPTRRMRDLVLIGATQAVALMPGISRSASTISCARLLGWTPREAVRFSFLLSIPTILAGNAWELVKSGPELSTSFSCLLAAFFSSFFVGLLIVRRAISWLEQGNWKPFAWYCFILGALALLYF